MNNTNNLTWNNLLQTNPNQTIVGNVAYNNLNTNNNINSLIISSKSSIIPITDEVKL